MTNSKVVVRFAPSPTGVLHIGSVRTALFNWLYARHNGGKFLLRIEDTDKVRSTSENTELIFDILRWLGIDYDDEAVIQSERLERHRAVAYDLVNRGLAYYCYCTPEELSAKRELAIKEGKSYKYDRKCRNISEKRADINPVIRLKAEIEGETVVDDLVQGTVKVDNSQLDDLILLRSDGTPTYMLSVVVDDHDMKVSHVIRGDDHLTNTFRQIQIYKACGWDIPSFAHIPLIYGPDGAKLSKRHGAVSAVEYRDLGYLPEAICNYLLRLGWSHGDDEIISREQAIEWFDFKNVGKSPSRFDINKLNHLNAHYMRVKDEDELLEYMLPFISARDFDKDMIRKGLKSLKERAETVLELAKSAMIYVKTPEEYDEKCEKFSTSTHIDLLQDFIGSISSMEKMEEGRLLETAKTITKEKNLKLIELAQSLRAALTGSLISPSVFEIMTIIGKEETLARINKFINRR